LRKLCDFTLFLVIERGKIVVAESPGGCLLGKNRLDESVLRAGKNITDIGRRVMGSTRAFSVSFNPRR
jgi:hypothetical protein